MSHLYLDEEFADIWFVFRSAASARCSDSSLLPEGSAAAAEGASIPSGEEENVERVPAHSLVLKSISSVFKAMFNFNRRVAEQQQQQQQQNTHGQRNVTASEEVNVEDAEPEDFKLFLRFLYKNEFSPRSDHSVTVLLNLARKYQIACLEAACTLRMKATTLNVNNVLLFVESARLFELTELEKKCWRFIDEHMDAVLAADDVTEISQATLCEVLKRNGLPNAVYELTFFAAAVAWADAECRRNKLEPTGENMRSVLGEALLAIRFPLMPVKEIAKYIVPLEILTTEEKEEVLFHWQMGTATRFITASRVKQITGRLRCRNPSSEAVAMDYSDDVNDSSDEVAAMLNKFRDGKANALIRKIVYSKPSEVMLEMGNVAKWMLDTEKKLTKCLRLMHNEHGIPLGEITCKLGVTERQLKKLIVKNHIYHKWYSDSSSEWEEGEEESQSSKRRKRKMKKMSKQ